MIFGEWSCPSGDEMSMEGDTGLSLVSSRLSQPAPAIGRRLSALPPFVFRRRLSPSTTFEATAAPKSNKKGKSSELCRFRKLLEKMPRLKPLMEKRSKRSRTMVYVAMKPTKPGLEEPQEHIHKSRITLSSKNVKNLEKVCADLVRSAKDKRLRVNGPVRMPTKVLRASSRLHEVGTLAQISSIHGDHVILIGHRWLRITEMVGESNPKI
ncbi:hypothetical protein V6N11_027733 [Hibiscus sabdariffa]|uniref:Small ribosomal subunit protein uS10 domain-containing protein n=1 Tax=Hibiscus sabdariffa TaxID=183260 RepID=A0ABR1ZWJ3_9ROSI